MDEKQLLFIVNPNAGKTAIKDSLFDVIVCFAKAGYRVEVYPTKDKDDAARVVREEGANYDLIVCAGGDGTLQNTVNGLMQMPEPRKPIGYIPVGSTNDFARSLYISRNPVKAANQIVAGKTVAVDVGQFNDNNFIYIAAFGAFTAVSYATNQRLKKFLGHSAYMLEGLKEFANLKPYNIRAILDDQQIVGSFLFGMVTNSHSVGGFRLRGGQYVSLDDGKFEVMLVRKPSNIVQYQKLATMVLTNNFDEDSDLVYMTKASDIQIYSDESIAWTLDGESGGEMKEVFIRNLEKSATFYLDNQGSAGVDCYDLEEVEVSLDDYEDGWD